MINKLNILILWCGASTLFLLLQDDGLAQKNTHCPMTSYEQFKKSAEKETEMIFFSSWCTDCVKSLTTAEEQVKMSTNMAMTQQNKKVLKVLVAAFDSSARASEVARKYARGVACITSDGSFEKALKVDGVPAVRTLE